MAECAKERARDRLQQLAGRGLDVAAFFQDAGEALARAVPTMEEPGWVTLDPASLLITSSLGCDGTFEEGIAFEYLEDDVLKTTDVVRSQPAS